DEVDVLVATSGHEGAGRAQIRVEPQLFAQPYVGRAIAASRRRRERTLERQAGAANAVEGPLCFTQRGAGQASSATSHRAVMGAMPTEPIPATLIQGDGVGPEIVEATLATLDALGVSFAWDQRPAGLEGVELAGDPLP